MHVSHERINFSQRLISTLASNRALKASPTILAREFNFHFNGKPVTVHAARKWLVGESIPTQDKMRALAGWLGVPVEWLRFGGPATGASAGAQRNSPTQDSLLRLYLSLPVKQRQLARDFIEMLVQQGRRENLQRANAQAEGLTHP